LKTIQVRLDPKSIEAAIDEINAYKKYLEARVNRLLQTMVSDGAIIARAKVVRFGIKHDTNLSSSINGFVTGNVGVIKVDDENAVFFEFGTGPDGAASWHPKGTGYRTTGWFTKADGKPMDTLYGWTPLGKDGDTYFYTEGQPAKPFMYETLLELKRELPRIAKEVFST
jgi:hypothetical protein